MRIVVDDEQRSGLSAQFGQLFGLALLLCGRTLLGPILDDGRSALQGRAYLGEQLFTPCAVGDDVKAGQFVFCTANHG